MVISGFFWSFLINLCRFLNIFLFDECLERRDSIDRGICLKIDGGWFDSLCIYAISGLQKDRYVALERLKGDIEIVDDL